MKESEIKEHIDCILALDYGIDDAEMTDDLVDDLSFDSLDRIDLFQTCETTFRIPTLNENEMEDICTVKNLIDLIEFKMKKI